MPQIWLTYAELGAELGYSSEQAREASHRAQWPHKHSQDGLSRTMLPDDLVKAYVMREAARMLNREGVDIERQLREALAD